MPVSTPRSSCTPSGRPTRYGVPAHAILQKVGEHGYVGGQEDMIIDIALQLREEQELGDLAGMGVR
jgi:4-hydroxy 2-oxovalerate aldolase